MCGIAGILPGSSSPLREPARLEAELARLATELAHRGPDASAVERVARIGVAHTRLAILDLSEAGAQPMWSPDRRFLIAYNGEVYNFERLRRDLEAEGERFVGHSDTEVVLRLLCREGESGLARLEGMFALALLEASTGRILLARDRCGQKPLYVSDLAGGGFAFASELGPLLRVPGADGGLCPEGLSHLLTFGLVPAPFTLRRGIRQLRPGTALWLRAGEPPREKRFVPEPGPLEPRRGGDLEELSRELEELLSSNVRDHLVADVPVGVLLSGGVDSSTVAALAARHAGRLRTFAVVHQDPAYDERREARAVAEAIGSEHHEIELRDSPLTQEELDTVVDHHGDPFADTSSLAVLRLSREIRSHVTVALSGDGGDELFAGYPRFGLLRVAGAASRVPRSARKALGHTCGWLNGQRPRQLRRLLQAADLPPARRMVAFTTLFWPEEQARLLRSEWTGADVAGLDALLEARGASLESDPVASAHWLEQRLVLPDQMLTKVDRMSMAASLEVRPPLLGAPVLEFAARLPFEAKHAGLTGKRVLRRVARRLVPAWVVDRPKRGFAVPVTEHGGRVFEEAARFALESETSPLRALFRPKALEGLARLSMRGEGREPEDSPYRRVQRRWLLTLLARTLERYPAGG
jgi:asparagine synthase (glutamine-hydrolysing)